MRVLSLFSLTPENVGDMACAWGNSYRRYYDTIAGHINDVRDDYDQFDLVVIGGGCLINQAHEEGIWRAIEKSKKCIIRAVGVKDWQLAAKLKDKLGNNFTIRHKVDGYIYESCPSLVDIYRYKLLYGVDGVINKTNSILFACHQNNHEEIEILRAKNLPVIVNNCDFKDAMDAISVSQKVVTSSYHFLLWSNEFNCDVELFCKPSDLVESEWRKFQNIPIKYKHVDIKEYF